MALRQRGLSVSEITDDGLFSEIRADREVRVAVSQEIQALGLDMPAAAVTPPPQAHELSAGPDLTKPNPPVERPHELGMSNPSTAATGVPGTPHEIGVIPNLPDKTSAAEKPSTEAPHEIGLIPPPQPAQQPAPATTAAAITPSSSSTETRREEEKRAAAARRPVIDDQRPQYPASARPNLFARNFYQDQKDIWFSPSRIRVNDLNWLLPAAGITAGLISADAELEQRAPDLPLASNGGTLSNAGVAALLGGAGGLFLIGHWQDDPHKREAGILALEAAADSMVVDGALKFVTQRDRPLDGNRQGDFFAQSGINSGFPSAHAALAWSSAAVLAHEYPSIWSKIFFYGTAAAVSYSRVAAQHHFPSDVVVGSLAGYLIGQHVYARHHDPQLEGGDYGTFNRAVLPEERSAASIASPYVPMDSWVYPAFDRLIALGAVRSGIVGIRPWTRRECARLLEEAADHVDPGGTDPVSRMYAALEREFAPEMDYPAAHFAQIDSIYTRVTGISGHPLTDDYHFGRTIVNDYGRPFQEGFNNVTGVSASSSIGALGFYVRGEYQHAPSGPGLTQAQQDAIQLADAKPLIPTQGPAAAVNDFRLLDTYVSLNIKGWQWSFGKQTLWTSETQDPFLWSDNAEPTWMFRMDQTTPRKLPILGFLGPYRTELWFGRLQGQHFVGSTPDGIVFSTSTPLERQPFVNGFKINFKPTENFEFGVGKSGVFGGPFFPVTMDTFWKSMFSTGNVPGVGDPGDRRSTFDFSYRIPGLRNYLMIYDDSFVEDEISPLGYPRRSAHNAGLYMPQMPFTSRLDFRFEGGYTNLPHLIEPANGGFFYWNIRYLDGYTNNGNILGNGTVGRQGISFRAASTYWVAPDKTIQLGYRNVIEDSMFAGGGNLRDITLRSEWSVRKSWSVSSLLQYEWWNFPVLTNGNRQNDFTASFQVTYHPHWKIGDAPKK